MSMSYRTVAGLLLAFTVGSIPSFGQRESDARWGDQFDFRFSRLATTIEYGQSKMHQRELAGSFRDPSLVQLKIGGARVNVYDAPDRILQHRYDFFSIAFLTPRFSPSGGNQGITTELFRFGPGWEKGYGYGFGRGTRPPALFFYHSEGLLWSRLHVLDYVADEENRSMLGLYNGAFRFGSRAEGGIRFQIVSFLSVDASFERAIVFRRHQVVKWMGSTMLEAMSSWLIDRLLDKIGSAVPTILPALHFILKNALSYGISELRAKNTYYPFTSEPPLMFDTVKGGLTITF